MKTVRSEAAVSTVVGAILVLCLIITIAAAFKMVYVPDMKKEAEAGHMQQTIQDMQGLKTEVDTLQAASTSGNGLMGTSRLEMGGGAIPVIDPSLSSGTVTVDPAYGNFSIAAYSNNLLITNNTMKVGTRGPAPLGQLVYAADNHYYVDQQVSYEGGMLVLSQRGGAVMLAAPPITAYPVANDANTTAIVVVNPTRITGTPQSLSSTGETSIKSTVLPASNVVSTQRVQNITIRVQSSHAQLWQTYFSDTMKASGLSEGTNYRLSMPDAQTVSLFIQGSGTKDDLLLSSIDSLVLTQLGGASQQITVLPQVTLPSPTATPAQAPVPAASISASPRSGEVPLLVSFQGSGTNSPTSFDWDFGDGSSHVSGAAASHIYLTPGSYLVTLVAGNAAGNSAPVVTLITVKPPAPVASFTVSPASGAVPLLVSFQGSGTNSPTSFDWDFGDGSAHGSGVNPTHTYAVPGSYTVTLIASNAGGNSAPYTIQNCITASMGTWGFKATYYSDEAWTSAAGTETLSEIKLADSSGVSYGNPTDKASWPTYILGKDDQFSVRFTGTLHVGTEADYTFYLTSDDGSWLSVDGTQVIDNGGLHSATLKQATVHLKPGYHPLEVKMYEHTGVAVARLEYSSPTLARQYVQDVTYT